MKVLKRNLLISKYFFIFSFVFIIIIKPESIGYLPGLSSLNSMWEFARTIICAVAIVAYFLRRLHNRNMFKKEYLIWYVIAFFCVELISTIVNQYTTINKNWYVGCSFAVMSIAFKSIGYISVASLMFHKNAYETIHAASFVLTIYT